MLAIYDIIALYGQLKAKNAVIHTAGDEIELHLQSAEDKGEFLTKLKNIGLETDDLNQSTLAFKSAQQGLLFFDQLDSLLDQLNISPAALDGHDFFVFDLDGHYFYYAHQSGEVRSDSRQVKLNFIIHHFRQYKALLDTYLGAEGKLFEIKRNTVAGSEFVVLSKGEKKLVTPLAYKPIDKSIFVDDEITIPVSEFQDKILSEEWLACYNETLCQFMDAQLPQRRSFGVLFNNFNYLLNLTQQNFQLYILKFSFDKIRKQFKTEKNNYFESLNTAQDKISSQIISVPISLGASIFSFYQFQASPLVLSLIYLAILLYAAFIGFVVVMNLYDIRKVARDANEEEQNLKNHYPDLLKELKKDFDFMKNKRTRVRVLAWAIILALVITLVSLAIFVLNYQEAKTGIAHFL